MSVLADLRRLSAAEEFFAFLRVEYDPAVVRVARLHVLRRMGELLSRADLTGLDEVQVRARCRAALEAAYANFVARTPLQERLFKVHKDAVSGAGGMAFVPLEAIARRKV